MLPETGAPGTFFLPSLSDAPPGRSSFLSLLTFFSFPLRAAPFLPALPLSRAWHAILHQTTPSAKAHSQTETARRGHGSAPWPREERTESLQAALNKPSTAGLLAEPRTQHAQFRRV